MGTRDRADSILSEILTVEDDENEEVSEDDDEDDDGEKALENYQNNLKTMEPSLDKGEKFPRKDYIDMSGAVKTVLLNYKSPTFSKFKLHCERITSILDAELLTGKKGMSQTLKNRIEREILSMAMIVIGSERKMARLEGIAADNAGRLDKLEDNQESLKEGMERVEHLLKTQDGDFPKLPSKGLDQSQSGESTLMVSTEDLEGAKSYRDALRANRDTLFTAPPKDVIITAPNKLIIKMTNRKEADDLRQRLQDNNLLVPSDIRVNRPRRNRLIVLGAHGDSSEDNLKDGLGLSSTEDQIEIVREFVGRNGDKNFIIDASPRLAERLKVQKHALVDLVRVKIEPYIEVLRCMRCQTFGHIAPKCKREKPVCAKCAGEHDTRQCSSTDRKCTHCGSVEHYAGNKNCQETVRARKEAFKNKNG